MNRSVVVATAMRCAATSLSGPARAEDAPAGWSDTIKFGLRIEGASPAPPQGRATISITAICSPTAPTSR